MSVEAPVTSGEPMHAAVAVGTEREHVPKNISTTEFDRNDVVPGEHGSSRNAAGDTFFVTPNRRGRKRA
jgi:hypothetical protein